jgi:hypothetical protein
VKRPTASRIATKVEKFTGMYVFLLGGGSRFVELPFPDAFTVEIIHSVDT